eukprot:m51a1_g6202 hypothetical protein (962) ;mRNA; r:122108-125318
MQRLASALLLLCAALALVAATPAFPGPYDMPLPDGTTLRIWNTGDEFTGPRYVDVAGRNVYIHDDGTPSYYDPTGAPAEPLVSRRQAAEQAKYSPATMPDEWDAEARQRRARFNEDLTAAASLAKRHKARATEPLVFVMVQYPDFANSPGLKEHILRRVFNASSTMGDTVNAYYNLASNGKFQFTQARETSDDRDDGVIGPVTVNCAWVNHSKWGKYPDYSCVQRSALLGAAEFLDLKSFDLDGDGRVAGDELHIVLVIAGGELSTLSPAAVFRCPHVWGFMQPSFDVAAQGVTFGQHVIIGESWDNCTTPFNIGVVTHELGHTMSMPDIYDQDTGKRWVGPFCLMDGGNWNDHGRHPAMISPFLRSYLGWLTPTVVPTNSTAPISLLPVGNHPDAVLQFGHNPNGVDWEWDSRSAHKGVGEYFLVENRQRVGLDSYAPAAGVIVWHINEGAAPKSTRMTSVSNIEKIVRKTVNALEGAVLADFLTQRTRQSMYCGLDPAQVPNSVLDNESASCVSLSASVDNARGIATIEPWTDLGCGSCVWGQGGIPEPTTEYSFVEQYGFSLVPMDGASPVTVYSGFGSVKLPFAFAFGGVSYTEAFICAHGYINFVGLNTAIKGAGKYPTIAPYPGDPAAASVTAKAFTSSAPLLAGRSYAVQWNYSQLTVQAVLHESGSIYYIYSGTVKTVDGPTPHVSTGAGGSLLYANAFLRTYDWTLPTAQPAAMLATPRPIGLLPLPFHDSFDTLSPLAWADVTCASVSDVCGSASGTALTFGRAGCHNRMAVPIGFDVSGCPVVSFSFFFGPAGARTGCSPVTSTIWWGYTLGALVGPSKWNKATVVNGTNSFEVATQGAESLYLSFDSVSTGMMFIDDFSVRCATQSSAVPIVSSESSVPSSAKHSSATSPLESSSAAAEQEEESSSEQMGSNSMQNSIASEQSSQESSFSGAASAVCTATALVTALLAL